MLQTGLCPYAGISLCLSWRKAGPGVGGSYPCSFSDGGGAQAGPTASPHTPMARLRRERPGPLADICRLGGGTPYTSALSGAGYGHPAMCQPGLLTKEMLHSQRQAPSPVRVHNKPVWSGLCPRADRQVCTRLLPSHSSRFSSH